jgi:hypothetical protein
MLLKIVIIAVLLSLMCMLIDAQERGDSTLNIKRNYIIGNASFEGVTLNYERNIIQWSKSYTNMRIGFGLFNDLQGGGKQGIATLVHLFGKKKSHLELNLGIKYFVNSKNNLYPSSKHFYRDMFVGYRYEKPDGNFIFRIGYIYPHIYAIAIGLGIKF